MKKKILLTLFAFFFLYCAATVYHFFFSPLVDKNNTTAIKVYPSEPLPQLSAQLYEKKIIQHPLFFQWLVEM